MTIRLRYQKSLVSATVSFILMTALSCVKTEGLAPANSEIPEATRMQAASTTATSNSSCTAIQPFYWEIGSATGPIGSGTAGGAAPTASTLMGIASASKFLFAGYVIEKKNGILTANDIKHLRFMAGYSTFTSCAGYSTVGACNLAVTGYVGTDDGKFYYGGGHFQKFAAVDLGLSALNNNGLAAEVNTYLGNDVGVLFSIPQPAGGMVLTPTNYAAFLRKILNQQLKISNFLGTNPVCTNTTSCASSSNYTPIPILEVWNYSLGHWLEADPVKGDGSFSSPGLYGFYPWINADKSRYGILARYDTVSANAAFDSVICGRLIRKAYTLGTAL